MAAVRNRPALTPRMLSGPKVAAYLGRSATWFLQNRIGLEAAGFPGPVAPLGLWDRHAIDRWLDERSGLLDRSEIPADAYDADWSEASRE